MSDLKTPRWLSVIGIGDDGLDGLSPRARARLDAAQVLVGGPRHLAMLPEDGRRKISWPRPLALAFDEIAILSPRPVAVLASGDPSWFGVGNALAQRFRADEIEILPCPSAFSLAAARLLWPLGDVVCLSLHGRAQSPLEIHISPGNRILVLSRDGATPGQVAARLCACGFGPSAMTVLEHIGGAAERMRTTTADDYRLEDVTDLNVIAVECRTGAEASLRAAVPGLADEHYENDGQITRCEVRAITLARLMPMPEHTLWDIGAGSGSISIEWLRACPRARAFAIETNGLRAGAVERNAEHLGVPHLRTVHGTAPAALDDLPDPDAVFIGGGLATHGAVLIDAVLARLRPGGRLVANAVTIASEAALIDAQTRHGGTMTQLAISRAEPLGRHIGWKPLMPVTQWALQLPSAVT